MIPRRIRGFNTTMGAPAGWNKARDGNCVGLAVRREHSAATDQVHCKSAWEPTPEELAKLNAGGSVILSVLGGQPPVMLTVESAIEEGGF